MVCARFVSIIALGVAVWAQSPAELFEKAPPQLDNALRARVTKFYQSHVEGKFRVADQVVAEDSKDAFFAANKTRFKAFEITKITYSDQFTKARVLTTCDSEFLAGATLVPVKMPITTLWKLVDGEWFWYVEPRSEVIETPFGKMSAGKGGSAAFANRMPSAATILGQVTVDRTEVKLSSYEPASAEVTVSNRMPGAISLSLSYNKFPGFEARLDRKDVAGGESAKILIECKPADKAPKPTLTLELRVDPTGRTIPIRVVFAVPPEIEKKLPK